MNKPKIDIVMSCYNSEKFIKTAIKSVSRQGYDNWELIIVDDFSSDKSVSVITRTIKKFKISDKVKLIRHEKNYGYGKTLKDAIENGDGELIAIVDSDDALSHKDALSIMSSKHIRNPDASLVYSNYYKCDRNLLPSQVGPSRQLKKNESYINTKIRISHLKVFKRSFYNKTGGVNPTLKKSVDKDLVLKLEEVGNFIYINKILYYYRCHEKNLTRSIHRQSKNYQRMIKQSRKQIYIDAKKRRGLL